MEPDELLSSTSYIADNGQYTDDDLLYLTNHTQTIGLNTVRSVWSREAIQSRYVCRSSWPPSPPTHDPVYLGTTEATCWSAIEWARGKLETRFQILLRDKQLQPLLSCGNGEFAKTTFAEWSLFTTPFPWRLQPQLLTTQGLCYACKLRRTLNFTLLDQRGRTVGSCGRICANRIQAVLNLCPLLDKLQQEVPVFLRQPNHTSWTRLMTTCQSIRQHEEQVAELILGY
jgi:hypothetical protein